jgi:protein SCO1/2
MQDDIVSSPIKKQHPGRLPKSAAGPIEWLVWGGLLLVIATLALLFLFGKVRARSSQPSPLPVLGTVENFNLTNQNGQAVSLADLRGHVWVADIIFTRCPGPCLKMSRQMREIQEALPGSSHAKLVTLTTDPTYDTPAVFRRYDEFYKLNVRPDRWLFLTGTKGEIAKLAVDSLKFTALEKPSADRESENDLFIHSTLFVIVDKKGQWRGLFETTGEGIDFPRVKGKILDAIHQLETER